MDPESRDFWLGIVAVIVPTVVPTAAAIASALLLYRSNRTAHAGIVERIQGAERRVEHGFAAMERRAERRFAAMEERTERRFAAMEKRTESGFAALEQRAERAEDRADRRVDALAATLEAQRQALEAIAREVSFLAGRQRERDQTLAESAPAAAALPGAGGDGHVVRTAGSVHVTDRYRRRCRATRTTCRAR